ncbi:MAG: immunoglobulin domain-containing protein [Pyrinomonadaceae bacterium]
MLDIRLGEFIIPIHPRTSKALLCVLTFFLLFVGSASVGFAQNLVDENGKIVLDQNVLTLQCRPGTRGRGKASKSFVVNAQTQFKSQTGHEEYKYSAEYGRLVVNGNKAEWDLTGERPGTYRIYVSVLKGGQTVAQYDTNVKIEENICEGLCECPTLTVSPSSDTVKNGETLTFRASLTGPATVSYTWTVKNGEIIEGQGTAVIKVRATRNAALDVVAATVSIGGLDYDCIYCLSEASASATIIL